MQLGWRLLVAFSNGGKPMGGQATERRPWDWSHGKGGGKRLPEAKSSRY